MIKSKHQRAHVTPGYNSQLYAKFHRIRSIYFPRKREQKRPRALLTDIETDRHTLRQDLFWLLWCMRPEDMQTCLLSISTVRCRRNSSFIYNRLYYNCFEEYIKLCYLLIIHKQYLGLKMNFKRIIFFSYGQQTVRMHKQKWTLATKLVISQLLVKTLTCNWKRLISSATNAEYNSIVPHGFIHCFIVKHISA